MATDPWRTAIDLLEAHLVELAAEDPDPEHLEQLRLDLEALGPALAGPPPAGQAAVWLEEAREAARLNAAVAEAAARRREDLAQRQQQEQTRLRTLGAYTGTPGEDPRFLDLRR